MDVPHDWSVELTPVHSAGVNDPALWSVDTPTLYHLRTDIVSDDSVVDITTTGFGFRYTTFDPDSGFSLNGQYMKIMGVDLHATNGPLGAAVHYDALELAPDAADEEHGRQRAADRAQPTRARACAGV